MIDSKSNKAVPLPVAEPATVNVVLRLLQAEQIELEAAVDSHQRHLILDEVTDVIYRARELAFAAGLTPEMLSRYATYKGQLRAALRKDKELELYIASGVVNGPLD